MSQRIFLNLLEECSSLIGTWRLSLQRVLKGLQIGYLVEFGVHFSVGWMRIVIFLVLLYLVITSVAVYKFFKVTKIFHPVFLIIQRVRRCLDVPLAVCRATSCLPRLQTYIASWRTLESNTKRFRSRACKRIFILMFVVMRIRTSLQPLFNCVILSPCFIGLKRLVCRYLALLINSSRVYSTYLFM